MRKWLVLAALVMFVSGCHSGAEKRDKREAPPVDMPAAPNGEASPFN